MTSTSTAPSRTVSLRPCSATIEIDAPRKTAALGAVNAVLKRAGFRTVTAGTGAAAFCAVQVENAAFGVHGSGGCLRRSVVLEAATRMARSGGGRMVLVTDALPWPAGSAHVERSARQSADLHWWQQLASRVAPHGVRMNAIRIGYAPFLGHSLPQPAEAVLHAHQVVRRPVTEADLQAALTLLLSRGLNAMVGEVLPLDGGLETGIVPVSATGTAKADGSTVPPARPWSLDGRTVLVTGGSSGIGAEAALELARRGADVVLAARRLPELDEVAAAIREHLGRRAWTVRADLSRAGAADDLVDEALRQAGAVHDFVHAAGVLPRDDQPEARRHREEAYRINVLSFADAVERLAQRWVSSGHRGNIVAVSSTSAQTAPVPGLYSYGSGKAAVAQLSTHLAVTLARHRIRVNSVLPGIVRTPMTDTADPAFVTASLRRIPSGRLCDPEDIAAAVAYLISPASAMVDGAQLRVCGGWATLRSLPAFTPGGEQPVPAMLA
ncbi:SDR family NAD(P)-dependent oxidoreductase [Amycolatopsis tucumanensis]|uniref:SDR family NAD(P)-dependent oxidoreductase n=1 Tax=Amycolatopsis tucumanensis TaxID=401106 RepID=UPI003D712E54